MDKVFFLPVVLLALAGCHKEKNNITLGSASVNVVNAVVNGPAVKINPNAATGILFKTAPQVSYGAGALYYVPRAETPVSIVSAADTNSVLLNASFNFQAPAFTLLLTGQLPAIDTLLYEETDFSYIKNSVSETDSSINIRFINGSPNSQPVNINIKNASNKEVASLAYKGVTGFKKYAAATANTSYIFEIRDVKTDALLYTYTFSITATNRFNNVALVIKGLQGTNTGTAAFGVFAANYF